MNRYISRTAELAIIAITDRGEETAGLLVDGYYKGELIRPGRGELSDVFRSCFRQSRPIVAVMATGIAVRLAAVLLESKYVDPPLVCVDDNRRTAISLLSGHEGGANNLAFYVASMIGAVPVVTTASDTNREYILGFGCRKDISPGKIEETVKAFLLQHSIESELIHHCATIQRKSCDHRVREAFENLRIPLWGIPEFRLVGLTGAFSPSAASRHLGIPGVCEPAALYTARNGGIEVGKTNIGGISLALIKEMGVDG